MFNIKRFSPLRTPDRKQTKCPPDNTSSDNSTVTKDILKLARKVSRKLQKKQPRTPLSEYQTQSSSSKHQTISQSSSSKHQTISQSSSSLQKTKPESVIESLSTRKQHLLEARFSKHVSGGNENTNNEALGSVLSEMKAGKMLEDVNVNHLNITQTNNTDINKMSSKKKHKRQSHSELDVVHNDEKMSPKKRQSQSALDVIHNDEKMSPKKRAKLNGSKSSKFGNERESNTIETDDGCQNKLKSPRKRKIHDLSDNSDSQSEKDESPKKARKIRDKHLQFSDMGRNVVDIDPTLNVDNSGKSDSESSDEETESFHSGVMNKSVTSMLDRTSDVMDTPSTSSSQMIYTPSTTSRMIDTPSTSSSSNTDSYNFRFKRKNFEKVPLNLTKKQICAEEITAGEMWLIKAPVNFNMEALNNMKISMTDDVSTVQISEKMYEVAASRHKPDFYVVAPSKQSGSLSNIGCKMMGQLQILEGVDVPPAPNLSALPPPPHHSNQDILKQRFQPFGADEPEPCSKPFPKKKKHMQEKAEPIIPLKYSLKLMRNKEETQLTQDNMEISSKNQKGKKKKKRKPTDLN